MELIKKALSLFSGTEGFVTKAFGYLPFLVIAWLVVSGILLICFDVSRPSDEKEHDSKIHSRMPEWAWELFRGGRIGVLISSVIFNSWMFVTFVLSWVFENIMWDPITDIDTVIAVLCVIQLLISVLVLLDGIKFLCTSVLTLDLRCFVSVLIVEIWIFLTGINPFIYAMMWYFSTV